MTPSWRWWWHSAFFSVFSAHFKLFFLFLLHCTPSEACNRGSHLCSTLSSVISHPAVHVRWCNFIQSSSWNSYLLSWNNCWHCKSASLLCESVCVSVRFVHEKSWLFSISVTFTWQLQRLRVCFVRERWRLCRVCVPSSVWSKRGLRNVILIIWKVHHFWPWIKLCFGRMSASLEFLVLSFLGVGSKNLQCLSHLDLIPFAVFETTFKKPILSIDSQFLNMKDFCFL